MLKLSLSSKKILRKKMEKMPGKQFTLCTYKQDFLWFFVCLLFCCFLGKKIGGSVKGIYNFFVFPPENLQKMG